MGLIKLSDKTDRAVDWSVEDMLDAAKEIVREEPEFNRKAVLILLDDKDGYNTRALCAGIGKASEVIALLEIENDRQKKSL
jgi:hypothetical protein